MFEDLLRRFLEASGLDVYHVMNITDVGHLTDDGDEGEDKMIKSARVKGLSVEQIAEYYTEQFFRDCRALNIITGTPSSTPNAKSQAMGNETNAREER